MVPPHADEMPVALESMNIVLRGPFAPAMFSPRWLRDADLVGQDEFESAQINIISQDQTSFELGWLVVSVGHDIMQLQTSEVEEFPRLRDAAIGVLRSLEKQQLWALGVNRQVHVRVSSREAMHRAGDVLAPKDPWDGVLELAAVRSLYMWGARPDGWAGRINVRVEPSEAVHPGIFVQLNDHSDLHESSIDDRTRENAFDIELGSGEASEAKARVAIRYLSENWDDVMQRWFAIVDRVTDIAEGS